MLQVDSDLILEILQGDQNAFDRLFAKYQNAVYRFVCYLTQNRNDADDLFQETWLRVVKYLAKTTEIRDFKAWVFTIAINLHRDELRRKRFRRPFWSQRQVDADFGQEAKGRSLPVVPAMSADTDRVEIGPVLENSIACLPVKQRRVFILKEIEGFKHKEIAEILRLPVGTVKSLLFRAIKRLQKDLAEFK